MVPSIILFYLRTHYPAKSNKAEISIPLTWYQLSIFLLILGAKLLKERIFCNWWMEGTDQTPWTVITSRGPVVLKVGSCQLVIVRNTPTPHIPSYFYARNSFDCDENRYSFWTECQAMFATWLNWIEAKPFASAASLYLSPDFWICAWCFHFKRAPVKSDLCWKRQRRGKNHRSMVLCPRNLISLF